MALVEWSAGQGNGEGCRGQLHAADLVKGAPVHGPQLDGGGSHNGGRPGRLEQQGGVTKHPPSLHVDLDLAALHLHTDAATIVEHLPSISSMLSNRAAQGLQQG